MNTRAHPSVHYYCLYFAYQPKPHDEAGGYEHTIRLEQRNGDGKSERASNRCMDGKNMIAFGWP